jgi:Lar family restriction alleviation protein
MSEELLLCPFCGGKATAHDFSWHATEFAGHIFKEPFWQVRCQTCKAALGDFNTKKEAIAAWNHRATPTAKRVTVTVDERGTIGHTECSECGVLVGMDDRYCRHCGKELT